MSRTAHHTSSVRATPMRSAGHAVRTVSVKDLRYSAACLAAASAERRRPRPRMTRRQVAFYSYPRAFRRPYPVTELASEDEGRARQALRQSLTAIARQFSTGGVGALDVDVIPARHRHNAIRNSW